MGENEKASTTQQNIRERKTRALMRKVSVITQLKESKMNEN